MESINLPGSVLLVWDLKRAIEMNQSIKLGLTRFLDRNLKCSFSIKIKQSYLQCQHGHSFQIDQKNMTVHQRAALDLMLKGLAGMSIYESLVELNTNMMSCCEDDIEKHVSLLPLLLQIPLLGLLFPAILMLLIIPALKMLNL